MSASSMEESQSIELREYNWSKVPLFLFVSLSGTLVLFFQLDSELQFYSPWGMSICLEVLYKDAYSIEYAMTTTKQAVDRRRCPYFYFAYCTNAMVRWPLLQHCRSASNFVGVRQCRKYSNNPEDTGAESSNIRASLFAGHFGLPGKL